jgi:hypothetical protein
MAPLKGIQTFGEVSKLPSLQTYLQKCRTIVLFESFYTELNEAGGLLKFARTINLLLLKVCVSFGK